MTTPREPREDQPPSGGQEPTPFDQAETQFAQIPPPDYPPPAYTPPPTPPASATPPPAYQPPSYPQQSYTPPPQPYQTPPSYQPQQPYPPQQPYQPAAGGYPPQPYQSGYAGGYGAPQTRTNGMAIGSLVASIIGVPLTFLCYSGALAAIVGIVLGFVAINQIKQSGEQGRGLAIAGIAVGAVILLLTVILLIFVGVYALNR